MKCCAIYACGIADRIIKRLKKKETPIESANTPALDHIAANGRLGRARMLPKNSYPRPDLVNFSILGYNPVDEYIGAGIIAAHSAGIKFRGDEEIFIADLVTINGDIMTAHPETIISNKEALELFNNLNTYLGDSNLEFVHLGGYRGVAIFKNGAGKFELDTTVPAQASKNFYSKFMPRGTGQEQINDLMMRSQDVLGQHEINTVRIDLGENPANMLWLWGPGKPAAISSFKEKFYHTGAVISRSPLTNGLAKLVGLDTPSLSSRTDKEAPNYLEKIKLVKESLARHDFVMLHLESSYKAIYEDNVVVKVKSLEEIDRRIVAPLLSLADHDPELQILFTSDFPVYSETGECANEPVPFALYGRDVAPGSTEKFSEAEAKKGPLIDPGYTLISEIVANL